MKADALIIFRTNHFLGQDILDSENKILELTGFSGSAGTLIITRSHAFLFVDGRYEIQARLQTDSQQISVVLCDAQINPVSWLKTHFREGVIAYNPWQISATYLKKLSQSLPQARLVAISNFVATPPAKVFAHELKYCGVPMAQKIAALVEEINKKNADMALVCAADSVSWLANIRSSALPETPIVRAYALVDKQGKITLCGDNLEFDEDCNFECRPIAEIKDILINRRIKKIIADMKTTPEAICEICRKSGVEIIFGDDSCIKAKAIKNPVEINGMINAHIRDGVAVCKFLRWFEKNYRGKSEFEIAEKAAYFRREQPLFFSLSFATIAASAENAAIIHYQPEKDNSKIIADNSLMLIDSGAQYFDGTTDITRTVAAGTPAKEQKQKFSLVLKAFIALISQDFPENTSGTRLDAICRSVLWRHGLDYKHGTGHGVGSFLNVHEGPQNLGASGNDYPLRPGMVVSIEPGYYQENAFGIRIENLVYVTKSSHSGFLSFAPLTLVPIDLRMIDKYLLDRGEIDWLNSYHQKVYQTLSLLLDEDELKWLEKACSPL